MANSIFSAMSANDVISEVKDVSRPKELWGQYWIQNEVCCLFADTNVGKSILAVQIGDNVARKFNPDETVLYYDFELSKLQFEMRYRNADGTEHHKFADNFLRVELNTSEITPEQMKDLEDIIISGIEANIVEHNAKAIIVDNISWLVNIKNSAASAGLLMRRLCALKKEYGLSILVLAHTNKRNTKKSIENNNMNGSKKLSNFFDAMFTIGKIPCDCNARYVMQTKVRTGAFSHGDNNVEVCSIGKDGPNLIFKTLGCMREEDALKATKLEFDTGTVTSVSAKDVVKEEESETAHTKIHRDSKGRSELVMKQLARIEGYVMAKYRPVRILGQK